MTEDASNSTKAVRSPAKKKSYETTLKVPFKKKKSVQFAAPSDRNDDDDSSEIVFTGIHYTQERLVMTLLVGSVAGLSVVMALAAMMVEKSFAAYLAFIFPLVMAPYSIHQRRQIDKLPTLVSELNQLRTTVNSLDRRNTELKHLNNTLRSKLSKYSEVQKDLEGVAAKNGVQVTQICKLVIEHGRIQRQIDQLMEARELQGLFTSVLASDRNGDFTLSEHEAEVLVSRMQIFSDRPLFPEDLKRSILNSQRGKLQQQPSVTDLYAALTREWNARYGDKIRGSMVGDIEASFAYCAGEDACADVSSSWKRRRSRADNTQASQKDEDGGDDSSGFYAIMSDHWDAREVVEDTKTICIANEGIYTSLSDGIEIASQQLCNSSIHPAPSDENDDRPYDESILLRISEGLNTAIDRSHLSAVEAGITDADGEEPRSTTTNYRRMSDRDKGRARKRRKKSRKDEEEDDVGEEEEEEEEDEENPVFRCSILPPAVEFPSPGVVDSFAR